MLRVLLIQGSWRATACWSSAIGGSVSPNSSSAGAALHDKDCVACHVGRAGGDGTRMYTRIDRRVTTPEKLKAQIAFCNSELGTGYFPEEEEHIAAYLNLRYYKFKE